MNERLRDDSQGRHDPYANSLALKKTLRARQRGLPMRLACLDIDSTLTGDREQANDVRKVLEERGFVVGFNTSRTEEMVMTAHTFAATAQKVEFGRPPPQLGWADDRRTFMPPETVEAPGVLDGDFIVGSSGTRLLWRQEDGSYLVDKAYEARYGMGTVLWRQQTVAMLRTLFAAGVPGALANIERAENYRLGRSDIYPPHFRVQVDFPTQADKLQFESVMRGSGLGQSLQGKSARRLHVTDDSHPQMSNWKVFVTPRGGTKAHGAEWLIGRLCDSTGIRRDQCEVLFAGDSFPDLDMGLLGGLGTRATLLLTGGSRLVEALTSSKVHVFAGQSLDTYRRRLHPTPMPGIYRFVVPCQFGGNRTVAIGDVLYPESQAVETVYRYVETYLAGHACDR